MDKLESDEINENVPVSSELMRYYKTFLKKKYVLPQINNIKINGKKCSIYKKLVIEEEQV